MNEETAQTASYPERLRHVKKYSRTLAAAQPAVMETFERLHQVGAATRALDRKTKELMALAISVVVRCDDCIPWHIHDSLEAGASRDEITDALGLAVLMGGGPAMIYACHAMEALGQLIEEAS
jgi:AhpD family alkylhydroperoxidase